METTTRQNQRGKTTVCNSNSRNNNSYRIACGGRTLSTVSGWSVIPILNSMQVSFGMLIDDLSTEKLFIKNETNILL